MKYEYEKPEMEIIEFSEEEIKTMNLTNGFETSGAPASGNGLIGG